MVKPKKKRNYTENEIKEVIELAGRTYISFFREKGKIYVHLICPNGHKYKTSLQSVKENRDCWDCANEKRRNKLRKDEQEVLHLLHNEGYELLSEYISCTHISTIKCPEGHIYHQPLKTYIDGHRCLDCFNISQSGSNSVSWNGGFRNLNEYLRKRIKPWKDESMESCNYKCVITGKTFDVIHHLYSYNQILRDTMEELNLPVHKQISNYTDEELNLIVDKFLEIHFRHPLGVCLTRDIHKLFHSIYGVTHNTPEQFYEFKTKWENGEINEDSLRGLEEGEEVDDYL